MLSEPKRTLFEEKMVAKVQVGKVKSTHASEESTPAQFENGIVIWHADGLTLEWMS